MQETTTIDPTTARYTLAAGVTAGAQVIDVTLTGGTFGAVAPTMAYGTTGDNDIDSNGDGIGGNDTTNGIADSVGAATATLVSGGGTTDSTAQFRGCDNHRIRGGRLIHFNLSDSKV